MPAVSANMIAEAVKRRSGKSWLWLYEIEVSTTSSESRWILLTSHHAAVTFDSAVYAPAPIAHERQSSGKPGDLAEVSVTLSNLGGVPAALLRNYDGLRGKRVIIRLVHEDLSAVADSFANTYRIGAPVATADAVVLPCGGGSAHDVGFPGNHFSRLRCGHAQFGDPETCGWTAALGGDSSSCDFTLDGPNGCVAHGNEERFGGWPSQP